MQAGRIVRSIGPTQLYYWNFSQILLKFVINYFNVYYKISTPVVFCPYTGPETAKERAN